jgi:hypothetical protein
MAVWLSTGAQDRRCYPEDSALRKLGSNFEIITRMMHKADV